jgi:ABC-type branched-subunit amino acid transport system substrate-binding protein
MKAQQPTFPATGPHQPARAAHSAPAARPRGGRVRHRLLGFMAAIAAAMALQAGTPAHAQGAGVTADTILIGRSAGVTGSLFARVKPVTEALTAYFAQVNDAGGINGRRLKFINLDDGSDPKRTAENVKKLVDEDKVLVLTSIPGSPQTQAAVTVASAAGVPLIGSTSGADSLRKHNRFVFHLKGSYADEFAKMAEHMKTIGLLRVAIVYSSEPASYEAALLARAELERVGIKPVGEIMFKNGEAKGAAEQLRKLNAQAVVLPAFPVPGAEFYKEMVKSPTWPQVFAWSIIIPETVYKEVGPQVYGLVVAQTVPSPNDRSTGLSREYQEFIKKNKLPDGGYTGLEGYVYARVLVEAIRRTGKTLTRETLITTLENMRGYDLGGDTVTFSPTDHVGRRFVDLVMVGKDGKFLK